MRAPALSVIVVAWNVRDLVLDCLRSVEARRGGLDVELILVDNGSEDGTAAAVRAEFPTAVVVENRQNLGFSRANNQGLALARGEYVLFLNSDTIVGMGTLERCVAELERDPSVGMVTCRLMYPDGRVQYEGGRNPYLFRDLLAELFYLHMLFPHSRLFAHHLMGDWDHRDTRDVEAILGAFMLGRRSIFQAVGGLPELVFMNHEDLSLCLRIRRLGHRIRYLGDVETLHLVNQTIKRNPLRWYLLEGEVKVLLIREAEGPVLAAAARALFGVRSLIRLAIALPATVVPGLRRWKERYPNVFHVERHALHLLWTLAPWAVRPLVPSPGKQPARAKAVA